MYAQPITSTIEDPVIFISPVETDSILNCSVTAEPAPTISQPFAMFKTLSFT